MTIQTNSSERHYRYIDSVTALFVAVLIISNVASTKQLVFGPFPFDGGTIIFPLSYIFGDILTEVYGYARSRRVIWLGFISVGAAALMFALVGALPPAEFWPHQAAYDAILGQTPRIVLASMVAYFAGEFSNAVILAKLKVRTQGRWLWARTISSTVIGQAIDTLLFAIIAFAGVLPTNDLWTLIAANYVFKVMVEVLFTPVTAQLVRFLKRVEGEDYYDRATNFNPFVFTSR
jgi:queuosine precursor transporter